MVVYLSKPMIMRINPYVGIARMRRYRIVDMCKGKRKHDYEAPMTSSLSDCTWLEKSWKFHLSTTWHPSLHFIFLLLDSSLSYLSCHSSSLSFFSFFQSLSFILSYTYIFLYFYIFLSFFSIHIFFLLTCPSLDIFIYLLKALNSSLSCMHTIWKPC
jgi:hypothetical protein